jgi:hypothetical protein
MMSSYHAIELNSTPAKDKRQHIIVSHSNHSIFLVAFHMLPVGVIFSKYYRCILRYWWLYIDNGPYSMTYPKEIIFLERLASTKSHTS